MKTTFGGKARLMTASVTGNALYAKTSFSYDATFARVPVLPDPTFAPAPLSGDATFEGITFNARPTPDQPTRLYLSVDLGRRPSMDRYGRNVAALLTLARYATFSVLPAPLPWSAQAPLPEAELKIERTSLASPWVSVLADLARNSAPLGYGAAALYSLHRLLHLVMTWQKHRQSIAAGALHLERLRSGMHEESQQQNLTESPPPHLDTAIQAAQALGPILENELRSPDDPRAA
ncbi:hypothetical protein [Amycolatopsis nigrescens]|uniref:hypothetical protein n=1 Tax=Amycolatopsis nigrescens TaxID=381445 RepID=UPI0003738064|nr:hypothetical protein [Amycolatopsis nigrescens]